MELAYHLPYLLAEQAVLSREGFIALAVTVAVFIAMLWRRSVPIELLFLVGLVLVTLAGVLTPEQALAGFSSKAVVMIGALFAASAGLRTTGCARLDWQSATW